MLAALLVLGGLHGVARTVPVPADSGGTLERPGRPGVSFSVRGKNPGRWPGAGVSHHKTRLAKAKIRSSTGDIQSSGRARNTPKQPQFGRSRPRASEIAIQSA